MHTTKKLITTMAVIVSLGGMTTACDEEGGGNSRYPEPSAGACFDSDSGNYSETGPYKWTRTRVDGVDAYVPRATPGGCDTFPLIGFAMGTFMGEGVYEDYYSHFASWGMMTIVDPDNLLNLGGSSLEGHLRAVLRSSEYGDRISKTGVIGHSQGGAAAVNIAMQQDVQVEALVGLMPALFTGSGDIDAAGLYIGASADLFGTFTEPERAYAKTDGPAFLADLGGEGHIGAVNGGEALSMSTTWFRCHLGGDDNACAIFDSSKSGNCTAFPGRWRKCEGKNF